MKSQAVTDLLRRLRRSDAALLHMRGCQRGQTLVEVLVAVGLLLLIIALSGQMVVTMNQRSTGLDRQADLQGRARRVLDELSEKLRMIGAHTAGPQPPNTSITPTPTPGPGAVSQFAILWAQPYDLMFNADILPERYAAAPGTILPQTLDASLPAPSESAALGAWTAPTLYSPTPIGSPQKSVAETYRISLDAGLSDGLIDSNDHSGARAPSSVSNAQNPSVYALVEECWYSDSDFTTAHSAPRLVLATGVRAWTGPADTYPNGSYPPPLFSYWLDESILAQDFNNNGVTTDVLLFGDDGAGQVGKASDGMLSADEIANLLGLNGLNGVGRAVSEAGLAGGPDSRFTTWRNAMVSGGYSARRIARILNRSITKIDVQLRLESPTMERWVVSPHSNSTTPYRFRDTTGIVSVTLYDQVFSYLYTIQDY